MKLLYIYLLCTVIFFGLDMIWLGLIAKNIYREKLGYIMSPTVNWTAAIIFYLIYIGGILYFAVLPSLSNQDWQLAALNGAILGMLCYATYDLTNLATLDKWPIQIVVIDIIWGTILTGSVATLTYFASTKFL